MRTLVLGGTGMLGWRLADGLADTGDLHVATRGPALAFQTPGERTLHEHLDVLDWPQAERRIAALAPDVIVNAVGLIKQRPEAARALDAIEVNAALPHRLAGLCDRLGARLIQFSTDCVFSGARGGYVETDAPDPVDLYGRTKLLGEPLASHVYTLRCSIIGLEQRNHLGLVAWFLAQTGPIRGYRKAIFSGLTTGEMARVVRRLLAAPAGTGGLYHLAADPISKHDLLTRLRDALALPTPIEADDGVFCDRSLCGARFAAAFGYRPPAWDVMIGELAGEIRARRAPVQAVA